MFASLRRRFLFFLTDLSTISFGENVGCPSFILQPFLLFL